ncbi:MAG: GTP cyclohydrolase II, partial [Vampirovibrionia bacterium]
GHTEASVDLARMDGLKPAGVICEVLNEDGSMARRKDLLKIAKDFDLKYITVAQLIKYRLQTESLVTREVEANLPTSFGTFRIIGYKSSLDGSEHVAIVKGIDKDNKRESDKIPVIRMHSECLTGDIFHSLKCDCGNQLKAALEYIHEYGCGAFVYLRMHEGRGIGLLNKIKAYELQECGQDTIQANLTLGFPEDLRDYGVGAQIILDLGIKEFKLITNNPKKIVGLKGYDLKIVDRVSLPSPVNSHNCRYLETKRDKMHHMID